MDSCHPLGTSWTLYCHLAHEKKWDLASYIIITDNIDTVEKLIAITERLSENTIKHSMLFLMKTGITPMWEDKGNRNGGAFSYKILTKTVPEVWKELMYRICGNTLMIDSNNMSHINGITISPKRSFSIIKCWMMDQTLQDPTIIYPISEMMKNGSLFKCHSPEF